MLLRLTGFLSGHAGGSAALCRFIADRLNDGWYPVVPGGASDVSIVDVEADGYRLRLVDHPPSFDRAGYYGDASGDSWFTVGVSENIVDASFEALNDAIVYKLMRAGAKAA